MLTNTFNVTAARRGTALPVVRPWASPSGAGVTPVFGQLPVPVVMPNTRLVAWRRVPATALQPAVMAVTPPTDIRKQNVHKTRVNAGGDGASGPHPEREPA